MSARSSPDAIADAEHAAGDRYQRALDEELADEAHPSAAERRAHRELVLPRGAARDQEVRDVDARDEQQEADGAEQRQEREPDIGDQAIRERLGAATLDGRVGVRILLFERCGDRPAARDAPPGR